MSGPARDQDRAILERKIRAGIRERRLGTALTGYGLNLGPADHRLYETAREQHQGSDATGGSMTMTEPAAGRMYAGWLGEDATFETDRIAGEELARRFPQTKPAARENRAFILRAVQYAAREGHTQFIDVGAGPPINPSVHATARNIRATARVVYVDSDPLITAQTLGDLHAPGVHAITGDLTDPEGIFTDPGLLELIDTDEPVCLILGWVIHFVTPDQAREATAGFVNLLAPGSLVIMSVGTAEPSVVAGYNEVMGEGSPRGHVHRLAHVAAYFEGLHLVEPGLVPAREWRPTGEAAHVTAATILAGVGRKL